MDQAIINAIAADAAALGRALYAEGVTDTDVQAVIVAGTMQAITEHEIAVHAVTERAQGRRYADGGDQAGNRTLEDDVEYRDAGPADAAARLGR